MLIQSNLVGTQWDRPGLAKRIFSLHFSHAVQITTLGQSDWSPTIRTSF